MKWLDEDCCFERQEKHFFDLAAEFWKALNKEILIRARLPEKGVKLGKSLINLR